MAPANTAMTAGGIRSPHPAAFSCSRPMSFLTTLAGMRVVAHRVPDSRFELIDGADHLLPLEQPRALASWVAQG